MSCAVSEVSASTRNAFTLLELLVCIGIIAILCALLLPGLSAIKEKAKATSCSNNFRQLATAMTMYCSENRHYPGSWWIHETVGVDHYVWPKRLVGYVANNRKILHCPAAPSDSAWDTNANKTLGAMLSTGESDPYGINWRTRFSIGYNDWGIMQSHLDDPNYPQLGMGGDVTGPFFKGWISESHIRSPSSMIMFGDGTDDGMFDASLDPTELSQWPSKRHGNKSNLLFVDGHVESRLRKHVIDPTPNNVWRTRWNNDNLPHNDITWSVAADK